MKNCSTCNESKPESSYSKGKNKCKSCESEYQRNRYAAKSEQIKKRTAEYYRQNKEKQRLWSSAWKKRNKAKVAQWSAKRRAFMSKATPSWSSDPLVQAYYDVCAFFNEVNGYTKYHVDHIVPLNGKNVCGLHVHNNLQVLPAHENMSKSNNLL